MKVRTREEYREIVDDWFTVKREFWDIESELKTLINKLISEKDGDNLCTLYDDLNRIEMEIMHKKIQNQFLNLDLDLRVMQENWYMNYMASYINIIHSLT